MINYIPTQRESPALVNVPSAWDDIPTILNDLLVRFNVKRTKALEFGVDQGYSTSALANYFKKVIGIDTFEGTGLDTKKKAAGEFKKVKEILKGCENVELIRDMAGNFMDTNAKTKFDLIHIDLSPHTYENILPVARWAAQHSKCVLIHDTELPEMIKMCEDLAIELNLEYHNYSPSHGLGILIGK